METDNEFASCFKIQRFDWLQNPGLDDKFAFSKCRECQNFRFFIYQNFSVRSWLMRANNFFTSLDCPNLLDSSHWPRTVQITCPTLTFTANDNAAVSYKRRYVHALHSSVPSACTTHHKFGLNPCCLAAKWCTHPITLQSFRCPKGHAKSQISSHFAQIITTHYYYMYPTFWKTLLFGP